MKYSCDEALGIPADNDDAQLGIELRRLWNSLTRGLNKPAQLEGLQKQQFWVLGALTSGPRRMSDLAECSQTSQASLTGIVDRLEERGLVHRTRSHEDRRVVEVELTPVGAETMRIANTEYFARIEQLLQPLEPAERDELLRLVRKLTAHRDC